MPATTRQQKRAKARVPARRRRRGQSAFMAVLVAILLGGGALAGLFRLKPPTLARGAQYPEHWHADYEIHLCGKRLANYPFVEGEVHTHGDGRIHIHPQTPVYTGPNANLGNFLLSVETSIGVTPGGKHFILFPDGKRYEDGGTCPGSSKRYDLEVQQNGEAVAGDPAKVIPHNGDTILVRFGPRTSGGEVANPLQPPATPVPSGAAAPAPTAAPRR